MTQHDAIEDLVVVSIAVARRGERDYLARVDLDGVRGRIGCRAMSPIASFRGAAEIAAEVLRGRDAERLR